MNTKKIRNQTNPRIKENETRSVTRGFEYELQMDILGSMIKAVRKKRYLTQEQLGELVGVKKAQISKLESSSNSATIDTILKVFHALDAELKFNVKVDDKYMKL